MSRKFRDGDRVITRDSEYGRIVGWAGRGAAEIYWVKLERPPRMTNSFPVSELRRVMTMPDLAKLTSAELEADVAAFCDEGAA